MYNKYGLNVCLKSHQRVHKASALVRSEHSGDKRGTVTQNIGVLRRCSPLVTYHSLSIV